MDTLAAKSEITKFYNYFKNSKGFNTHAFQMLLEDTDELTVLRILSQFLVTITDCKNKMLNALESDDPECIWKCCHKIAGSADLLGFTEIGSTSRTISQQLKANPNITVYSSEIDNIIQLISKLVDSMLDINTDFSRMFD